ncbi:MULTISPECIES: YjzD family protein [unclassified Enterococcus]|uniref:YjzD family protein n=1 Tax=unclassified Enterococcus TaxID=2608891 RepID=UPI003F243088
MRYIVALFWAVILGQVVGYIGGALSSSPYDFTMTTIISLVAGLIVILISAVATPKKETSSASHS